MSTTQFPPEPEDRRHPYLRLVSSKGDATAPAPVSDDRGKVRSAGYAILADVIRGFALAGEALHATPESGQAQSGLPDQTRTSQPAITALLAWLKNRRR